MRAKDYCLPEFGPASNPVLYGVAHGLSELFPLVELSSLPDETDERVEEVDTLADNPHERSA